MYIPTKCNEQNTQEYSSLILWQFNNFPITMTIYYQNAGVYKVKNKLIIANLNINSVPGKFEQLKHIIQDKVDVLVLTETKIDSSFSNQQFYIEGFFLPFWLDRNKHGEGIFVYIQGDIPSKALNKMF